MGTTRRRPPKIKHKYTVELVTEGDRTIRIGPPLSDLDSADAAYRIAATNNAGGCVLLRRGARIIRRSDRPS